MLGRPRQGIAKADLGALAPCSLGLRDILESNQEELGALDVVSVEQKHAQAARSVAVLDSEPFDGPAVPEIREDLPKSRSRQLGTFELVETPALDVLQRSGNRPLESRVRRSDPQIAIEHD